MSSIVIGKTGDRKDCLDVDGLLRGRMLIQAGSGKGKSWLLRRIAEQLFGKVQIIIIDPEGEFATLREKFGYVLVGKGGETPADPRSAALVAHKLLSLHASAVCDLYEMKPSLRHEWVRTFCEALINAPKELWHPVVVIIDEAHTFCPEKGAGESVAAESVIGLATRGRKRGYALVLATQRLGKLRKDAAAELQNVMIGGTFIDVDRKRAADTLGVYGKDVHDFFDEIKMLKRGLFYALGPAISLERILVEVGSILTTHPEAGSSKHSAEPPPAPEAIAKLLPKLSDLPKQAEEQAKTEAEYKAQIRSLKAQLRTQPSVVEKAPDPKAINRAVDQAIVNTTRSFERVVSQYASMITRMQRFLLKLSTEAGELAKLMADAPVAAPRMTHIERVTGYDPDSPSSRRRAEAHSAAVEAVFASSNGDSELPEGERSVLEAIARYDEGVERNQITVLTSYKRSTRDAYISRMKPKGLIDERNGKIVATQAGIDALGRHFKPQPATGDELQAYWLPQLPDGEKKLLELLLAANGEPVDRDSLDGATGYARSSRDAYLARLSAKRLVESVGRGQVKAAPALFA